MKTREYGIAAGILAIAVIGLTGCEATVENPPATSTHTTTVVPGPTQHDTTVVPVPGPSSNTHTETHTEKTTVLPGGPPPDAGGASSSSSTSTSKTNSP